MAIEKFTTKSIVLAAYDQGEHDRVYKVFTRDFGMLMVHAKSIRKLESKMRSHVSPGKTTVLTLVKGREIWRLVGVEEDSISSQYLSLIVLLLTRFIQGEGTHKSLYDRIMQVLTHSQSYDKEATHLLIYYVLLVGLGYADAKVIGTKDIKEYVTWSIDDLYTHLVLKKQEVKKHIHMVLKEMQL